MCGKELSYEKQSLQKQNVPLFFCQMKKDSEFADVRTITNFSEEALQTALAQVKEVDPFLMRKN